MKTTVSVVFLCVALLGCATVPTPDQNLAKELAYCGWLGNDLKKSDPRYDKGTTLFIASSVALTSQDYLVRAMMDDPRNDNVIKLSQKEKETEFSRCQSLVKENWPQIEAALTRTYGAKKLP